MGETGKVEKVAKALQILGLAKILLLFFFFYLSGCHLLLKDNLMNKLENKIGCGMVVGLGLLTLITNVRLLAQGEFGLLCGVDALGLLAVSLWALFGEHDWEEL